MSAQLCLTLRNNSEQKIGNPVLMEVTVEWGRLKGIRDSHSHSQGEKLSQIPGMKAHTVRKCSLEKLVLRSPSYNQELARPVV